MLRVLTLLTALVAFASFGWGMRGHFRTEGAMPRRMKALSLCSTAAFLLFCAVVLLSGVGRSAGIVAVALFLVSTLLFWWAVQTTRARPPAIAHTDNVPIMIHMSGPYAFVRHPFYLAYCIGWVGTAVAAGPIQWLPALLIIAWYYRTAREEEKHFAVSALSTQYAEYRKRSGLILPRVL